MKQMGNLSRKGCWPVIDESIKDARLVVKRNQVVIGNSGRDEGTMAFPQKNLVTRATHPQGTVALNTHGNDEAVVLQEVAMKTVVEFQHSDTEIG